MDLPCPRCGGRLADCMDVGPCTVEAIARRVVELLHGSMAEVAPETAVRAPARRAPSEALVRDEVLSVLVARGPLSANDVEKAVRRRRSSVRAALRGLGEAGLARRVAGQWESCQGTPPQPDGEPGSSQ
jgi:hypothetical protein